MYTAQEELFSLVVKILNMNNLKISFEALPEVVSYILDNIIEIKKILNNQKGREPTLKKHLTISEAIQFLGRQGFIISKSKLYKLTSSQQIPYSKFNNKLVFSESEIQNWIDKNITYSLDNKNKSIENVIKSASRTFKNKNK